jgi:putative transposase
MRSDWQISIRRACGVLAVDRSLYHYKSRRGEQAELKQRIREIVEPRVRYGYRRIHVLLYHGPDIPLIGYIPHDDNQE